MIALEKFPPIVGFEKWDKKTRQSLAGFWDIVRSNIAVHADQKFCIVAGTAHTLKQEFHSFLRSYAGNLLSETD